MRETLTHKDKYALAVAMAGLPVPADLQVSAYCQQLIAALNSDTPDEKLEARLIISNDTTLITEILAFDPKAPYEPEQQTDSDDDEQPKKEKSRPPKDDAAVGDWLLDRLDKYAHFYDGWHKYSDGMWKRDDISLIIWDALKELRERGVQANAGKVYGVDSYLKLQLRVDEDKVDSGDKYINLKNGLYNLETGQLEKHREDLYLTSQLPFDYDPAARAPVFNRFLREVLTWPDKSPDQDMIDLLLEAFGYSLTADTSHTASFWLCGQSGSGKSTLLDVLIALAGNSHATIDLNNLNDYTLADLPGKRVVTFTEPDTNTVLPDGSYKRLVSKDRVTARYPYGKPFSYVAMAKVWGAMNETPRVLDRSNAVFRRVVIFPFHRAVPAGKDDIHLDEKLRAEHAGIFNMAVEGLRRLRAAGRFTVSEQVEAARAEFQQENDIEAAFVDECCDTSGIYETPGPVLYDAYREWCKRNGNSAKSSRKVSKDWKRLGFDTRRSNGITFYVGVGLNQESSNHVPMP